MINLLLLFIGALILYSLLGVTNTLLVVIIVMMFCYFKK